MPNDIKPHDIKQNPSPPMQFKSDRSTRPLYRQVWWKMAVLGLSGASLFLIMTLIATLFSS